MNFFKPVYDGIMNVFNFIKDSAGIDFYAFIALAIVAVSVIAGVLMVILCQQAKTARRLVKINNFLLKNKKEKDPNFFDKFIKLVTKGNNRVVVAWQGYVFQNGKKVSDVFKDNRLYSGYTERSNFVSYIGYVAAFLLFIMSVGTLSSSTIVLLALYQASAFPVIILLVVFIYSCFFNISKKATQNKLVEYSQALCESVDIFFVDEKENLAKAKSEMLKKMVDFADAEVLIEEEEEDYRPDRYLEDSATLEKQRALIRAQFDKEIRELKDKGNQLEEDIRKNREELLEVRNQIKETDDKTVITSLKQQEDSQLKLISALEKLKGAQQKQYIEVEAKLQTELKRIDETLNERRKSAEEKMKKELDEFADNLISEKQKQIGAELNSTSKVETVKDDTSTVAPAQEIKSNGKKNINQALSELLNAMNKYTDEDKK